MSPHHIIALLVPSWGHAVSYIYLATRILQKDPNLVITIVQHNSVVPKFELELRTCQYDIERLRIIGAGDKDTGTNLKFMEPLDQLAESWREIIPGMTQENEGWPKPHAVHARLLANEKYQSAYGKSRLVMSLPRSGVAPALGFSSLPALPSRLCAFERGGVGAQIFTCPR
ncbi:hypothetical protein DFH09DRAFT_1109346 [Mycena vulgaris]|nr:hypothetical protein DFH09DRAFT_1109346 [Mycena vulgaris]